MKKIWTGAVLAATLTLAACGGDKPAETAKTEANAPAAAGGALAVPDEANGGTITGKVAFTGEKPKMPTLDMSANPACERAHKGAPQKSEEVAPAGSLPVITKNSSAAQTLAAIEAKIAAHQRHACQPHEPLGFGLKPHRLDGGRRRANEIGRAHV